ncbi:MAG: hypothetical protein EA424_27260 [Planctomycetaceae bacterium]|nr:MAG: hypothetical protein EA424_27260 [Planctomycetaceae bacterium]
MFGFGAGRSKLLSQRVELLRRNGIDPLEEIRSRRIFRETRNSENGSAGLPFAGTTGDEMHVAA